MNARQGAGKSQVSYSFIMTRQPIVTQLSKIYTKLLELKT